ncbi:hypothetical protein ACSBR2_009171 [Camellia fascicularis]
MAKFAQDLKDRFLRLVEAITSCKSAKDVEEPHLKTVQRAVKGPTRPPVTKDCYQVDIAFFGIISSLFVD